MKKSIYVVLGVAFLLLCGTVLRPVPIVTESECLSVGGLVTRVFEGGEKDIVFVLGGEPGKRYYINRGMERGLDLKTCQREFIGKEAVIKFPPYWTPLDPSNSIRHLSKLEIEGEVVFDETRTAG